ncbi:hypothetical protein GGI20_005821 [Coemansia sp. BCRC 34301]|nr:hypothetical protein GGI20_005821 [Coemansia sp. BCRC 34301]
MARLSTLVLACTLAATTAVAAPGASPQHRGIESILQAAGPNGFPLGDMATMIPNREDQEKYKSASEQAVSALLAGKMDAYYSYMGDAALIADKYMADSQVASMVSMMVPFLKMPLYVPELDKARESYLARLENPIVQQNFASVMQVVNEMASYQAGYIKSAYSIDVNSFLAQVVSLAQDANRHATGEDVLAPSSPTSALTDLSSLASTTTSESSSTPDSPDFSDSSDSSDLPGSSDSSDSSELSDSSSSDTKPNDAGSNAASYGMLPLGVAVSALAALF